MKAPTGSWALLRRTRCSERAGWFSSPYVLSVRRVPESRRAFRVKQRSVLPACVEQDPFNDGLAVLALIVRHTGPPNVVLPSPSFTLTRAPCRRLAPYG